jgi:hypothetical protein
MTSQSVVEDADVDTDADADADAATDVVEVSMKFVENVRRSEIVV